MSSDLSAEITAIATAVLAAFAIITAVVAYTAFRRQTQEVGILQRQVKEQQDVLAREARARHRAQASRVFISVEYPEDRSSRSPRFNVANTSEQPVYKAEIRWRYRTSRTPLIRYTLLATILPGDRADIGIQPSPDADRVLEVDDDFIVLVFRDAGGVMWVRKLDGELSELATPDPDQQTRDHRQAGNPGG